VKGILKEQGRSRHICKTHYARAAFYECEEVCTDLCYVNITLSKGDGYGYIREAQGKQKGNERENTE
jgi:hypothetical protein